MLTVKECTDIESALKLCARFKADAYDGDRIFVLSEGGEPLAVGVLGLKGGKVILKGVFGCIDESYRDLVFRSLLHVCRCMNPITVRVEKADNYFVRFGFTSAGDGMEVPNSMIKFE